MSHRTEKQPQPRGRRVLRVGREVVLTLGALAGVLCMVLAVLAVAFDVKPVVFRSGSMSPAIDTGALAISRTVDASDMKVGDVVTVTTSKGVRVTHRIQSITRNGDEATLILRGDANAVADEEPYVVKSADRVLFDVPKAGYVVNAITGKAGVFGGGLLVGLVLITAFSRRPRDEDDDAVPEGDPVPLWSELEEVPPVPPVKGKRKNDGRRRKLTISVALLAAGAVLAGVTGSTGAYFTDSASVASGTFTMKNTPPPSGPVVTSCVRINNGNNGDHPVKITWNAVPDANGYKIVYNTDTPGPDGNATVGAGILTFQTPAGTYKNLSGTISVVATFPAAPDSPATVYTYTGSGNPVANYTCTPAP